MSKKVLIVDDESSIRDFLSTLLKKEQYEVMQADSAESALQLFLKSSFDAVISDCKMPGMSGIDLLKKIRETNGDIPVIMVTAYGSTEDAVDAMKLGAADYLTKPFKVEEIKLILAKSIESASLKSENIRLKSQLQKESQFQNIVGSSRGIQKVIEMIKRVSDIKAQVLITGESGTGKELIAKAIHYSGPLKNNAFVAINCGALPENLLESELFGHKKGSFTGATADKDGLFKEASGGTLFLDEVGEMPLSLQVKLLRALQEKTIRPVGGVSDINIEVRIISATNKNLEEEIANGSFREDLFYRLNVIQIQSPALRDRPEDIPILAKFFLKKYSTDMKKGISHISNEAMEAIQLYPFPGNVRELENSIERAVALEAKDAILLESLPQPIRNFKDKLDMGNAPPLVSPNENTIHSVFMAANQLNEIPKDFNLEDKIGEIEKKYLELALKQSDGSKTAAAETLGITFRSMRYRCKKYGLSLDD